tara:strand:- start:809 stop:1264 length:456 start_codon:yes stop_codon:yes gene_type:complete
MYLGPKEAICKLDSCKQPFETFVRRPRQYCSDECLKKAKSKRHPNWDKKYSLSKVLVKNSTYARICLKKRLIREQLLEYKCAMCGLGPEWRGKPMPLILDHINGVNNDNRIENLRFVCSNCDCQLPTYKSRNRKRSRSGMDEDPGLNPAAG